MTVQEMKKVLSEKGQEHVLTFLNDLTESEQNALTAQVSALDWDTLGLYKNPEDLSGKGNITPIDGLKLRDVAVKKDEYFAIGKEAIKAGKVGAVLLAGGQGTRLGSDAPKGAYNIGITHDTYIFECLIRNLQDVCKACDAVVPLFVMTSEKNDEYTRKFLKEHNYFGYPETAIHFFVQDMAPCVDFNGKLFLEEKGRVATSPNGNGGWYSSLERSGILNGEDAKNLEWLNVFAVDNVLQRIADPVFVGATIASGVNCGAKVVCKAEPHEKVGVLCLEDGQPNIIEYYELTEEMANATDENGELQFIYGVILNYLFSLERLREIAKARIPVHVVKKKIPYLTEKGELVKPEKENGYKFETLILDMIKLMGTCLPLEVEREKEFAPIKNKTGVDSVESARELLKKNGVEL